ncbi:class I SAM-dependent DNA methyltransferase [Paracidobacterium acidisoli]|uniref:Class I SAM-dependent methyltransferase n=1 Tax=Paracidobacterium acidisoli TaxID=2303751 RepID=A0A372ILB9_9BACT|nr:class I SAM-dependent methyltransferase [Paracidobacterium acidisoli]MBT9332353.1 methyltransferase domain-containing protein [Paracidobacterium acidisoli]
MRIAEPIPETYSSSAVFDTVAETYDQIFTHTCIGNAQRFLVHDAIAHSFHAGEHILELNCGTGEDALHLASQGISVTACDTSERMLDIARQKLAGCDASAPVTFTVLANEDLETLHLFGHFDGALSNFGGLNCSSDLPSVARKLAAFIRPGGNFFLCMLGRTCLWEMVWYYAHGQREKALRRHKSGGTRAHVGNLSVQVFFPTVDEIRTAFAPSFRLREWRGIGVTVPPSWLEPFFCKYPALIAVLTQIDRWVGRFPLLRNAGDHTLFHFVREGL